MKLTDDERANLLATDKTDGEIDALERQFTDSEKTLAAAPLPYRPHL